MPHLPAASRPFRVALVSCLLLLAFAPIRTHATGEAPVVGYLRTRYAVFSVSLLAAAPGEGGSGAEKALNVKSVEGRAAVPPGEYYISSWMVEATDAEGHRWHAKGNMIPTPITIHAGQETTVGIASPLQAHLLVLGAQDPVGFRLEVTGPFGERCRELRRDGEFLASPQLDILDARGRLVERITFQGRCGGTCLTTWTAPAALKGQFTALPNVDLGPLAVEVGTGVSFTLDGGRFNFLRAAVGKPAPDFALTAHDATLNQLSFMRGKPVILSFFCACGLCKAVATEMGKNPDLAKRARVLAVLNGPAYAQEPALCDTFLKETGFPGRLLLDLGANVTLQYRSAECPRLWAIDANGIVRHTTPDRFAPAEKIVGDAVGALGR